MLLLSYDKRIDILFKWRQRKQKITAIFKKKNSSVSVFATRSRVTSASWYFPERVSKTETKEKSLFLFVCFFAHKKYYRCFIKLRLNHWCHMDYFNDVLTTFLGLERVSCAVYGEKYLNLCSKNERRSYGFVTTWRWVIMTVFSFLAELSL